MCAKRKSRRRPVEPVDWEELARAPSLKGLLSFLHVPPEESRQRYERTRQLAPLSERVTGMLDAPIGESPMGDLPIGDFERRPSRPAAPQGKLQIALREPEEPAPAEALPGSLIGRRQKIYRAVRAQDGHSAGEQLLYQALWRVAEPEGDISRRIRIGYGGMQELCKLDRTNCKKNIRSLMEKLAVEVIGGFDVRGLQGYTYRIYPYSEILKRRREAGMEYVIRTSGVRFVNPPIGNLPMGDFQVTLADQTKPTKESSSVAPVDLGPGLRKHVEGFDDSAAAVLWGRCRAKARDCTAEEVLYCFEVKARQLLQSGKTVSNPVGLLLTAVPKCFEGPEPLYLDYRRRKEGEVQARESAEAEHSRLVAEQEAILADPEASEEDKRFARMILGKE